MRTTILAATLLLAACDSAPTTPARTTPEGPSDIQARVIALSDNERNLVFIRALRDANKDCQGVTKSERQTIPGASDPLWVATCQGGATYGITIGRDGVAQVVGAQ
ncbi:hypothetical protein M9980_08375 [Sphingomonas donggukensis]|uniref:Lipoprotein n=1 Tax=Sphingomonas donggukensis TaxID=2949093 RepID=A0ABY4TT48_9SPHN|nr:hypothetical protein [Sphingomonas donggukensis]URW74592.1 hypothetical protein M9980_08375 [Sphingomonas donggukensis]